MKATLVAIFAAALTLLCVAPAPAATMERAVFAGGCFWGMQAVFESVRGVKHVTAGYSGGAAVTAHYDLVGTEMTGHAESVQIDFDPSQISFNRLLDVYFLVAHDPTELNRQGPDEGSSYRSEIFYTSAEQQREAATYIAKLERNHVFPAPIVTKLEPLKGFYPAEAYHQDYFVHNPDSGYIVANDIPKVKMLETKFPQLVNRSAAPVRVAEAR